jgi:predicted transglutaminase-like cysteine proteinase
MRSSLALIAMLDRPHLQTWNRAFNQAHALTNEALALADEGKPGWDCKGFCALKFVALRDREGFDPTKMWALIVDGGAHCVLEIDLPDGPVVLDNLSAWLNAPTDYAIAKRIPAADLAILIPQAIAAADHA